MAHAGETLGVGVEGSWATCCETPSRIVTGDGGVANADPRENPKGGSAPAVEGQALLDDAASAGTQDGELTAEEEEMEGAASMQLLRASSSCQSALLYSA